MLEHQEPTSATQNSMPSASANNHDKELGDQVKRPEKNVNLSTPARHRYSIAGRTPLSPGYGAVVSAVSKLNRLDDFVLEQIAKGFFSDVFKVWHRTSGEVMVLKMNTRNDNRANVIHEVELLNRLKHKNIVRFKGVCVHNGQLHALTEYINGGDLQNILLDENVVTLSWQLRMSLSQDVANGMSYVHSKGYIHRDLTAMNILVRKEGSRWQGVVADFGLATTIPKNNEKRSIAGSPYWMAPECLRSEFFNEKADVFSYGIILCQVIARIQADPNWLPRLQNFAVDEVGFKCLATDCPDGFLQLAYTCCNMDYEQRPSCEEVSGMLNKMLRKLREDKVNQNSSRFKNQNELIGKKRSQTSVSHLDAPSQFSQRNFLLTRSSSARLSKHTERPHVFSRNISNPFDTPELKGGQTKIVSNLRGIDLDIPPKLSAMFDELDLDEQYFQLKLDTRRKSISLPSSPNLRKKVPSTEDNLFEDCVSPDSAKAFFESKNVELTNRLLSWRERKQSGRTDGSGDWEIIDAPPTVTVVKSVLRHDSGVCSLFDDDTTPSNSSHGSVDDAFIGATSKRNSTGE